MNKSALLTIFGAGILLFAAPFSQAAVITFQPVTAAPGATNVTFDVTLLNDGTTGISVAGFSFGFSAASSDVSFTAVDTSTMAPYIFSGHSLFGPDISVQPPTLPGQTLAASDNYDVANSGVTVAAGATVGLGDVHFDLSSQATPGPILVSFLSNYDSLSDPAGNSISFTAVNSTITVQSATPEPATGLLLAGGVVFAAAFRTRKSLRSVL